MKITKQKRLPKKTKIIILIGSIVVALLIAAAVYLVAFKGNLLGWQPFGNTPSTVEPITEDSPDTNHGTKDDTTPGTDKTTDEIPVSETLAATIMTLSQSNGQITFTGSANDNNAGGTCSIVFTNPNDRPVSRSANTTQSDGEAICGPIQIPETEFSFLGEWTATFRYYSGDTQAVTERTINIQ
jgi:hypothetical protein